MTGFLCRYGFKTDQAPVRKGRCRERMTKLTGSEFVGRLAGEGAHKETTRLGSVLVLWQKKAGSHLSPLIAVLCPQIACKTSWDKMEGNTLSLCKGIVSVTQLTCASCRQCRAVHDCLLAALPRLRAAQSAGLAAPWQAPSGTSCRLQKK